MVRGALLVVVPLVLLQEGDPSPAGKSKDEKPPPAAARVVGAVAKEAKANAARPAEERLSGDALADRLVRRAAAAAEGDGTAFLVALAHAFDPDGTLARLPATADRFRGLESEEEAAARRDAMGKPTLRGRSDLLKHFFASAALAALLGEATAGSLALAKEVRDARGGSGFSFADLLADDAGIAFAKWLGGKEGKERLAAVAASFRGEEFLPDPAGLPEGLSWEAFAKEYGSLDDDRFRAARDAGRAAVARLPPYAPKRKEPEKRSAR